jgi:hypothetical protein
VAFCRCCAVPMLCWLAASSWYLESPGMGRSCAVLVFQCGSLDCNRAAIPRRSQHVMCLWT